MNDVTAIATIFSNFEAPHDDDRRENFPDILDAVARRRKSHHALWTIREPNALDGLDAKFANGDFGNETGTFAMTVTNSTSGVRRDIDTNEELLQDYHQAPKARGRATILEPYERSNTGLEEDKTFMTSLAAPIRSRGAFVVGIDLDLRAIAAVVAEARPFPDAGAGLLSEAGANVALYEREEIGSNIAGEKGREAFAAAPALLPAGATSLVARRVAPPIADTSRLVGTVADGEGDLRSRTDPRSKDEVGELAGHFNRFTARQAGLVASIRAAAGSPAAVSDELSEALRGAADAAGRIGATVRDLEGGVETRAATSTR